MRQHVGSEQCQSFKVSGCGIKPLSESGHNKYRTHHAPIPFLVGILTRHSFIMLQYSVAHGRFDLDNPGDA
jgi:hypothetical protein